MMHNIKNDNDNTDNGNKVNLTIQQAFFSHRNNNDNNHKNGSHVLGGAILSPDIARGFTWQPGGGCCGVASTQSCRSRTRTCCPQWSAPWQEKGEKIKALNKVEKKRNKKNF